MLSKFFSLNYFLAGNPLIFILQNLAKVSQKVIVPGMNTFPWNFLYISKPIFFSSTPAKLICSWIYWLCQISLTSRQPFRSCIFCRHTCTLPPERCEFTVLWGIASTPGEQPAVSCRGELHAAAGGSKESHWETPVGLGKVFQVPSWCLAGRLQQTPYF